MPDPLILRPGDDLEPLHSALAAGELVLIPTDTVYGVACAAHIQPACAELYRLKERDSEQPTAIVCGSVETVFESALPELFGRAGSAARKLLPGAVTLVVPNPARRFRWLSGGSDSLGVRVPVLEPSLLAAIDRTGALAVASANRRGESAPASFVDVAPEILAATSVAVDFGACAAGAASTVIDLRGREPEILREGPVSLEEIRRRLA